jgi:hypothetical protein
MRSLIGAALVVLALIVLPGGAPRAHEGHDHGDQPATAQPIAPRASSVTDTLELVAVARGGTVAIHLDRFETNEPVTNATIEVETPAGTVTAQPAGPGSWVIPAPWTEKSGEYDLTITVTADGETNAFPVTLDIHAEDKATPKAASLVPPAFASDLREKLAHGGWLFLALGFGAGALSVLLLRRRQRGAAAALAILLLGLPPDRANAHDNHEASNEAASAAAAPKVGSRDQAQRVPDGSVFVPKPTQRLLALRTIVTETKEHPVAIELPGRIIADPNGSGLVQSAQGGRLSAPPSGFPRIGTRVKKGDILAYATAPVQLVDASDMLQRQGELDQQIAIVEKRVARFESLAKSNIVSQVQLDEAKAELKGLRDRRAQLDRVRAAPEPLVAPIDGIVAEANAVAGQIAQPSAIVFQIMDPQRLLVEALSFEAPSLLGEANARPISGEAFRLRFLGAGLADRNQAVPIHFAIEGAPEGLRIGQFVTVTAARDDGRQGIAVPRASVVRGGNGQSVVFEKTAPERFEPREVRVEPLDGERVIVASGLGAAKRIVTGGAELLNQIR